MNFIISVPGKLHSILNGKTVTNFPGPSKVTDTGPGGKIFIT